MLEAKDYQMSIKEDAFAKIQSCFANLNAMFDDIQAKAKNENDIDGVIETYRKELKEIGDFVSETQGIIKTLNGSIETFVNQANDAYMKAKQYYGWWQSDSDKSTKLLRKLRAVRETLDLMID